MGSLVASGTAELGFQQLSELKNVPNIEVVGPLPPAIQSMTTFSGGISVSCADPAAARQLLAFMASPATAAMPNSATGWRLPPRAGSVPRQTGARFALKFVA